MGAVPKGKKNVKMKVKGREMPKAAPRMHPKVSDKKQKELRIQKMEIEAYKEKIDKGIEGDPVLARKAAVLLETWIKALPKQSKKTK